MFKQQLHQLQTTLENHEIYNYIKSPSHLKIFMESHVFAVWDFMSLAKRLQIELTCIRLPWFTPVDAKKARFINEIILGEESDLGDDGLPASHFDMYLAAMADMGCSRHKFDLFEQHYRGGIELERALELAEVPSYVINFVRQTIATAVNGLAEEAASSFFYGREDAIPQMFQALLDQWGLDRESAPRFVHYLQRHIDLDGDEHGPAAMRILSDLIIDEKAEAAALLAAQQAISARIALWDGILADMKKHDAAAHHQNANAKLELA
ncbi:hypothetical protein C4J95_0785 [Pseudomonas orientalis]|uniref:DUF3050 domain-containing protein n=1 Tax=Pseudomonas orientalis TaxID=76758 RepID=UPI000F5641FA|nr:DUF3050 domain-containing protein [Pseudomonas orientalis]AZE92910.1 hypothetical protein C4J96_0775 [Pseudomonas orientalis]AZE98264.1 hypothetical protein C4J95_0785 [Pseudomonas orientalis]